MPGSALVETTLRQLRRSPRAAWAETPADHFNRVLIEVPDAPPGSGLVEVSLSLLRRNKADRASVNGAPGGPLNRVGNEVVSTARAIGLVETNLYRARRARRVEAVPEAGGHFNRVVSEVAGAALASGLVEISLRLQRRDRVRQASANGVPGGRPNRAVSEVADTARAIGLVEINLYRARGARRAEAVREAAGRFNRVVSAALVELPGRVVARAIVLVVMKAKIEVRGAASSCPAHRDRARRVPVSSVGSVRRGGPAFHRGRSHESRAGWAAIGCADC
jgi:hypothetical protein